MSVDSTAAATATTAAATTMATTTTHHQKEWKCCVNYASQNSQQIGAHFILAVFCSVWWSTHTPVISSCSSEHTHQSEMMPIINSLTTKRKHNIRVFPCDCCLQFFNCFAWAIWTNNKPNVWCSQLTKNAFLKILPILSIDHSKGKNDTKDDTDERQLMTADQSASHQRQWQHNARKHSLRKEEVLRLFSLCNT